VEKLEEFLCRKTQEQKEGELLKKNTQKAIIWLCFGVPMRKYKSLEKRGKTSEETKTITLKSLTSNREGGG